MKLTAFEPLVTQRKTGSIIVFAGEDLVQVDRAFALARKELLPEGTEDFSCDVLHADNAAVTANEIILAAETMPFMGGFRLVLVRHAEDLAAEDMERLAAYAADLAAAPRPDMLLMLWFRELDKRSKFYKVVAGARVLVDVSFGEITDLAAVARARHGKTLEREAEALLKELVGTDSIAARNELDKVCEYAGARQNVTAADVLEVCIDTATRNEWEVADMLLEGNLSRALEVLADMRRGGAEPVYEETIVATGITRMALARAAARDGSLPRRSFEFRLDRGHGRAERVMRHLKAMPEHAAAAALRAVMYLEVLSRATKLPVDMLNDTVCAIACRREPERP